MDDENKEAKDFPITGFIIGGYDARFAAAGSIHGDRRQLYNVEEC